MLYIEAKVDGFYRLIVNGILRIPLSSEVKLICGEFSGLTWEYKNTELEQFLSVFKRNLPVSMDQNTYFITSIDKFSRADIGFYSCFKKDFPMLRRTVLITNSKLLYLIIRIFLCSGGSIYYFLIVTCLKKTETISYFSKKKKKRKLLISAYQRI